MRKQLVSICRRGSNFARGTTIGRKQGGGGGVVIHCASRTQQPAALALIPYSSTTSASKWWLVEKIGNKQEGTMTLGHSQCATRHCAIPGLLSDP
ncbi:MAG: hypothetical protein MHMPM18_004098 [Marteilia pararefringens]